MKKIIFILVLLGLSFGVEAQDLISGGKNSWIFHTPDDDRTTLYIAPKTNGNWDWGKQTVFLNDGKVNFSNTISVNGDISGNNIISQGKNSWIFHTPDDDRTTLYIAPRTNGNWDWGKQTVFLNDGKVNFSNNISVRGKIETKEIIVTTSPTADFVFESDYQLPSLSFIEKHIKNKKHLPEIASAKEMEKNGVNIGEFQIQLLQKIEELTLYIIQQEKRINKLETKLIKE
ncbi:hypothetical protein [Aquimarina sp. I32.4]|uniref:hypothetical protein n=1 Tax=Aquimarina sp. I32.4 TaxID=2053903 RepID=UPI001E521E05|nr:hypothetical protein [Aquimarina sp. I32.4]